jgi:TolA-binding protein
MTTEYKVTPSGRLYLSGVEIPQDDRDEAYRTYVAWLREGNGPEMIKEVKEIEEAEAPVDDKLARLEDRIAQLEDRIAQLQARPVTQEKPI